ncbi:MAG: hypothetical protein ACYDAQ_18140 [Mycobacteriales bacterium]
MTTAAPPTAAHAGSVSYRRVPSAAAILLTADGNVPPEGAARCIDRLLGVPVSAGSVDKANARTGGPLAAAGLGEAMRDALAAEPVLAAPPRPGRFEARLR